MALGLFVATGSDIVWLSIFGWILTFAVGSGYISTSQEYLTATMGDLRAPAVSWNNSALYAGTAIGTFLLGLTELGSAGFIVLATSFGGIAALLSGVVMLHHRAARSRIPLDTV